MRGIDRWFAKHGEQAEARVALEEAVLAGRFYSYAFYRLRYFFGRTLLGTAVHFIEFYFLILMFDGWQLTVAVMVRAAESLLSGWWWGGLEVMREEIRALAREKRTERIPRVVASWMAAARYYAALAIVATGGWVAVDVLRTSQQFNVFHLFVLVAGVRLALGFITRTYHSGAFAMHRIYRPFGAVIGVDLLGSCGTVLCWPWLHSYSLPILSLVTTIIASWLTFVYVQRVYHFTGLDGITYVNGGRLQSNLRQTLGANFQAAGLANAAMSLDGLLVFVLACGSAAQPQDMQLFFLFYLIAPLLRATHDWSRLFYFDLMRLDLDLFSNVCRRFSHQLVCVATVVGAVLWFLASASGTIGVGKNLGWMYVVLLALFMVRALLAFYQLQAFSQKQYTITMASGVSMIIALVLSCWTGPGGLARISVLVCGLILVIAALQLTGRRKRTVSSDRGLISPAIWLSRVAMIQHPVRVRAVRLTRGTPQIRVDQFAMAIANRLGPLGDVAILSGGQIGWYECRPSKRSPDNSWLLSHGAGLVDLLHDSTWKPSGCEAVAECQGATRLLGDVSLADSSDAHQSLAEPLVERFRRTCSEGMYWDLLDLHRYAMKSMDSQDCRDVMRSAVGHAKNFFASQRVDKYDVTTFCEHGEMRLIFAIPRSLDRVSRANWKSYLNTVNVRCALDKLATPKEKNKMHFSFLRSGTVWFSSIGALASAVLALQIDHAVQGDAELKSAARSEIRAPAAAFVQSVNVAEGDEVSTSTDIARLCIPDLKSKIAQTEARLREVDAEIRMLKAGARPVELEEQRRAVSLLEYEVARCKDSVQSSARALAERLASLDKQTAEWKAKLEFTHLRYRRSRQLQKSGAVPEEEVEEIIKEAEVAKARLGQIAAERRMYREEGTVRADSCLAQARKELAEARSKLALLEAGSRPEEIEAAEARHHTIAEELKYLKGLSQQLTLRAGAVGIVATAGVTDLAGTYLREGDLICSVENPTAMNVEIMISEDAADRVREGQNVRLKFRSLPYEVFDATVEQISVATAVDEEGESLTTTSDARLLSVRCCVLDEQGRLRPGMTGYGRISLGKASLASIARDHTTRFFRREFWW